MLRKSTSIYNDRWVEQTKSEYKTTPRPETVAQHTMYWEAIVRAVESSDFEEVMGFARQAGRFQASQGLDLSDAIGRTMEATNMIEMALLEANDGAIPGMEIVNEVADLRSMLAMAVAEGFKTQQDEKRTDAESAAEAASKEELRGVMMRKADHFEVSELPVGGEIDPLYEGGMKFHFVDFGKLRLYNLLPNGRCITISILGPGDVFLQWRAESGSLSCLCAEAMQPSRVITASERDMTEIVVAQPTAAVDVIASFARRLTESQVLIEDLLNNSVNLRLYRTLLELSKQFGRPDGDVVVIDFPLTHQRLADMIGSNRVTVTRKLHELLERNIIETRKNATIALRDSNALAKLAESGASE
ncbi:MAG: Crp/Fnr family transcriptional regulator [Candidatus Eremiobacteraeota bacterium]|nr:Crp/Fnr family transcriptional regulator [Candidatus Eremiobacteraeota bacterium]